MSTSAQRARRREQRDNTRREILAATERLLRERPYRELSVEVVMAQTGLTRTAFYRHFDDVTELVLRLLEDVGRELHMVAERWLEGAPQDFAGAAREGLRGTVSFFEQHGQLVRAIAEAAATDEQVERGYRSLVEAFIEMTAQGLEQLVSRGECRAVSSKRPIRGSSPGR
jgi:TetR/AcrR family transcriptional regulator, ethionamide resistance regulator